MQKISTEVFEKQLQAIDPRILIIPNKNRPGASNIHLNGADICPWIPSFEVQDEHTPDYVYMLNDMPIPFKTSEEAIEIVTRTLEQLKQPEYADALFDAPVNVVEETYGQHKA
jgi:hypothetical protein